MSISNDRMQTLRANGRKPVRITGKGEIFIGDEQILADYPIKDGSISVSPWHGKLNQLTLTLVVGPVKHGVARRR